MMIAPSKSNTSSANGRKINKTGENLSYPKILTGSCQTIGRSYVDLVSLADDHMPISIV